LFDSDAALRRPVGAARRPYLTSFVGFGDKAAVEPRSRSKRPTLNVQRPTLK